MQENLPRTTQRSRLAVPKEMHHPNKHSETHYIENDVKREYNMHTMHPHKAMMAHHNQPEYHHGSVVTPTQLRHMSQQQRTTQPVIYTSNPNLNTANMKNQMYMRDLEKMTPQVIKNVTNNKESALMTGMSNRMSNRHSDCVAVNMMRSPVVMMDISRGLKSQEQGQLLRQMNRGKQQQLQNLMDMNKEKMRMTPDIMNKLHSTQHTHKTNVTNNNLSTTNIMINQKNTVN